MASQLIASIAAVGLLGTGLAAASETRSFAVLPALTAVTLADGQNAGGQKCEVVVNRGAAPGAADIARTMNDNGDCVCTISTGPELNNGAAEAIVVALLRDRECESTPPPGAKQGVGGGAAAAGGLAAAAAAAAAGLGGGGTKSPG